MPNHKNQNHNKITITTLGNFSVRDGELSLTDEYSNSLKLWELFKYMVTYRDELLLPEKIIEAIWPDANYQDPKRTLRALIFRLRKVLSKYSEGAGQSIIVHAQGCYKLVSSEIYCIDIVEYEKLFKLARHMAEENLPKAIELYDQIIDMYKKDYLSESYEYEWLIPARNHYRRIFLKSVYKVSEFLKAEKEYQRIIVICENTLKYEQLEEGIHFNYIEALAKAGQIKQAVNHYKYVVEIFECELGVKPSDSLSGLYRLLIGEFNEAEIKGTSITDKLQEDSAQGAILCEPAFFKLQYQLEKRRAERGKQGVFLGLLTISLADCTIPSKQQLRSAMQELRRILVGSLRKGDIIAQWNKTQFIMSLPGLSVDQVGKTLDRVNEKFIRLEISRNLILHRKIESIR